MIRDFIRSNNFKIFTVLMLAVSFAGSSFAQVAIVIDTDSIFTEANSWIVVFTPIVAIGLGIAIALAILNFIGKEIIKAFKGG